VRAVAESLRRGRRGSWDVEERLRRGHHALEVLVVVEGAGCRKACERELLRWRRRRRLLMAEHRVTVRVLLLMRRRRVVRMVHRVRAVVLREGRRVEADLLAPLLLLRRRVRLLVQLLMRVMKGVLGLLRQVLLLLRWRPLNEHAALRGHRHGVGRVMRCSSGRGPSVVRDVALLRSRRRRRVDGSVGRD